MRDLVIAKIKEYYDLGERENIVLDVPYYDFEQWRMLRDKAYNKQMDVDAFLKEKDDAYLLRVLENQVMCYHR